MSEFEFYKKESSNGDKETKIKINGLFKILAIVFIGGMLLFAAIHFNDATLLKPLSDAFKNLRL